MSSERAKPVVRRVARYLELAWRRLLVRLLATVAGGLDLLPVRARRRAAPLPAHRRVLFLRPDRIGDMIVSTGVLRAIGSAPGVRLDVLASPANAPVLAYEPHVHRTLVLDRRDWRALWCTVRAMRGERYDMVVDCMPTAPSVTTLLLMLASGAVRRVGIADRGLDAILSPALPSLPIEAHIVDHLARLLPAFRDDVVDPSPVLVLTEQERDAAEARWRTATRGGHGLRLLVNISVGKSARQWPVDSYAAVVAAARAATPALQLVVMSAPHEQSRGERLASLAGGCYVPTASLREAFAFVGGADALFTPDTSIAHAAAALRVPTVDLLLAGKASQWGLYRAPGINLESPDGSLASLPVQQAAEALCQLLHEVQRNNHFTPSCLRRNEIVRGQASLVAARLAASSDSSRLVGRGSF